MSHVIVFILSVYGLWYAMAIADTPIIGSVRDKAMMRWPSVAAFVLCPLCFGFWLSLGVSVLFPVLALTNAPYAAPVIQALCGAAAIFLIDGHVKRLEAR